MSRLLWFLLGSAATLVVGAAATYIMDDEENGPAQEVASESENNEGYGDENPSAESASEAA